MSTGWQLQVSGAATPPLAPVFTYEAVIRLDVEYAQTLLNANIGSAAVRHALEREPEWTRTPWPQGVAADTDADANLLALRKLEALFDFAATPADGTADQIAAAIDSALPQLRDARAAGGVGLYKQFEVEAFIRTDGTADWSYTIPEIGELPPGIVSSDQLDDFIRNTIRIELKRRLGD